MIDLLSETSNPNLFLYLATALVRSGNKALRTQIADLRDRQLNPAKRAVLRELLLG